MNTQVNFLEYSQFNSNWSLPSDENLENCFTTVPKLNAVSCELRINCHLQRLMKPHQLSSLLNSLAPLPIETRIHEKLLEIVTSSLGYIERKMSREIPYAVNALSSFVEIVADCSKRDGLEAARAFYATNIQTFEHLVSENEQMIWAAMSNMKHLRYIAQMIVIPEFYHHEDGIVPYKAIYVDAMKATVEFVRCCKHIRVMFAAPIYEVFGKPQVYEKPVEQPKRQVYTSSELMKIIQQSVVKKDQQQEAEKPAEPEAELEPCTIVENVNKNDDKNVECARSVHAFEMDAQTTTSGGEDQ